MKPALLVIDIQQAFFKENTYAAESLGSAVYFTNQVIDLFREKNLPVVCVQNMEPEWDFVPGSEGYDIPDNLKIEEDDIHIHKTYRNSFNKTELGEKLDALGVDTVFIAGYSAAHCILGSYRGAEDRDLNPILVRGAVASGKEKDLSFVLELCNIISVDALKTMLA